MKSSHNYLVDGKYAFKALVNLNRLQGIFERFARATGFKAAIISYPGKEKLLGTDYRYVCTHFHLAYTASKTFCEQSNQTLESDLKKIRGLVIL